MSDTEGNNDSGESLSDEELVECLMRRWGYNRRDAEQAVARSRHGLGSDIIIVDDDEADDASNDNPAPTPAPRPRRTKRPQPGSD